MIHKPSPKRTLGPVSASVLSKLTDRGKTTFTLDDVASVYSKDRQATTKLTSALVKRGVLARIKSGAYVILQMGQQTSQLSNWPVIARELVGSNDYYISYYSAMRTHGMTTHPLLEITITVKKRLTTKKINNITYRFIYSKPDNFWGSSYYWVSKQEKVLVSDLERTILDALDRPELCGGVKEIVRGLWSKQKQIDWKKLLTYANKFHAKSAVKRLGLILEILNIGIDCIPKLHKIINPAKDYVLLDPNSAKKGQYVSRWRIRININIEELKASVWG